MRLSTCVLKKCLISAHHSIHVVCPSGCIKNHVHIVIFFRRSTSFHNMLGRKADHRTSPMNRTQLLDPNAMLRGPAPRSNESSQALLAAAPKNLPPASAKQFPTTFASSHGQAERYRGNSQFSIHLNDGFSPLVGRTGRCQWCHQSFILFSTNFDSTDPYPRILHAS